MAAFLIEPQIWDLFPQLELGVIVAWGICNDLQDSEAVAKIGLGLQEAQEEAKKYLTSPQLSQCPVVAIWREAFKKFKTKRGARCSVEALLKRVESGKGLGSVNPLVDLYNTASLRWGLPCGGEDLDAVQGNLRLHVSPGG